MRIGRGPAARADRGPDSRWHKCRRVDPTRSGAYPGRVDVGVDGRTVRIVPHRLACCAVELDDALRRMCSDAAVAPGPQDAGEPDVHVLVVAGTVTRVGLPTVLAAFEALPEPRAVVAFGACTLTGGPYWDSYSVVPGLRSLLPGAVEVAGCPPRPDAVPDAVRVAALHALGEGS